MTVVVLMVESLASRHFTCNLKVNTSLVGRISTQPEKVYIVPPVRL